MIRRSSFVWNERVGRCNVALKELKDGLITMEEGRISFSTIFLKVYVELKKSQKKMKEIVR